MCMSVCELVFPYRCVSVCANCKCSSRKICFCYTGGTVCVCVCVCVQRGERLRASDEVWRLAVSLQTAEESRFGTHVHHRQETDTESGIPGARYTHTRKHNSRV